MGKLLYVDPFAGVAGDMFLGALLDLGLDLAVLQHHLSKLKLEGYQLASKRVMRGPISATKFDVQLTGVAAHEHSHENKRQPPHSHDHGHGHSHAHEHAHAAAPTPGHAHRTFASIKKMIEDAELGARVKTRSLRVFERLAAAEGRIHNMPPETVTFHEVGAIDSLVDVVGSCIGLELLGADEIHCGPVAVGAGGFVHCRHGELPLPAPAALEILKGVPLRESALIGELTTPTGAALVAALATRFGPLPAMSIEKIGYGAGTREEQATPNVVRLMLGQRANATEDSTDSIVEIQTNIDDATPETLGYLSEKLLAAGALDVFFTPIQMKKSRPATLLTVLAEPAALDSLADILFSESSSFGLRHQTQSRLKLSRRTETVSTNYGALRVKVGCWKGREVSVHPEFEDCRRAASEHNVPLKVVLETARLAHREANK